MDQIVYVRSAFSKLHVAVERDGVLLSSEACNLDDLDHETREVIYSLAEVDASEQCRRCFPHVVVQGDEASVPA